MTNYRKGTVRVGSVLGGPKIIYLPHSCDEWEIGTPEDALLMIDDLNEAIKKFYEDDKKSS